MTLDRVVHDPACLAVLTVLAEAGDVEFRLLEMVTGLTRGNLSSLCARQVHRTVMQRLAGRILEVRRGGERRPAR